MKTNLSIAISCMCLMGLTAGCATSDKNSKKIGGFRPPSAPIALWHEGKEEDVRLTTYYKGGDKWSRKSLTSTGVPLLYITADKVGVAATPPAIPRWSIIQFGDLFGIAADCGSAVTSGKAAKKSGKTPHQKKLKVIDFCCGKKQMWPDFVKVKIFRYCGPLRENGKPPEEILSQLFNRSFVQRIVANSSPELEGQLIAER